MITAIDIFIFDVTFNCDNAKIYGTRKKGRFFGIKIIYGLVMQLVYVIVIA